MGNITQTNDAVCGKERTDLVGTQAHVLGQCMGSDFWRVENTNFPLTLRTSDHGSWIELPPRLTGIILTLSL